MAIRLAINGFGRIGRAAFKIAFERPEIEVVAVNDVTDAKTLAYLLTYDSVYGTYPQKVSFDEAHIMVANKKIPVFAEKEPAQLPWHNLQVDVVIESTGKFRDATSAGAHVSAGAKRVIISAPSRGEGVSTYIIGVNEAQLADEPVIDNASCTTNCITPIMAILDKEFGVLKATMTTLHAYTQDQNLLDGPHYDLRRGRTAATNIVPTSTGAADATGKVLKNLHTKFSGIAIRVPVACGSISDITALVSKKTTATQVNAVFEQAAMQPNYKGILAVTKDPIVSSDIVGRSESAIVDLALTQVVDGDLVKIFAWYDNELGYSHRLIETVTLLGKRLGLV